MPALVASAPGRVNLIGEHTDYNRGLCLPLALPQRTTVTLTPRDDLVLEPVQRPGGRRLGGPRSRTGRPAGRRTSPGVVADAPRRRLRRTRASTRAIDSDVPLGAGLSSSAALECAVAVAVAGLLGLDLDDADAATPLADACIRAENDYVGAPTGGMDQTVAMLGRARPRAAARLRRRQRHARRRSPSTTPGWPCSSSTPGSATASPTARTATGVPSARRPPRPSGVASLRDADLAERRADGRPGPAPPRPPRRHREPAGPRRRRGARRRRLGSRCRRPSTPRTSRCATTSRSPAASSTSPSRRHGRRAPSAPG